MAVWWVWIYTSWVTNWLDPEKTPVRLLLFGLMLAGLVLSTSIPQAFESKGLAFAGAYVVMQVGRSLFMVWALKGHSPGNYHNFQRIACWLALSGLFWIAGAFAQGDARFALWAVALVIEYVGPSLGFRTPGLGRLDDIGLGRGRRPPGRALRPVRHHRARRVGARHRRDIRQVAVDAGDDCLVPRRVRRQRGHVVDLLQYRGRARQPPHRRFRRPRQSWAGSPTPTCICCWWRASSSWPSATNWCWRIRPATRMSRPPPC